MFSSVQNKAQLRLRSDKVLEKNTGHDQRLLPQNSALIQDFSKVIAEELQNPSAFKTGQDEEGGPRKKLA